MEFSEENYSVDEDENFQPTLYETNAESLKEEIPLKANYKKWINSQTEFSHISSIINLEIDTSNEKTSANNENNQKEIINNENKNDLEEYEGILPEKTKEEKDKKDKIFIFVWSEGGNDVKLTGSFCNWNIRFDMKKDPNNNIFKCELPLDNAEYQFKFIVDNDWKYSSKYPTQKDAQGNINNFLDLTNYFKKDNIDNNKPKEKPSNKEKEISDKTKANTISDKDTVKIKKRKESIYNSEYPSDDSINPLPLPNKRYFKSFKLDKYSHQNIIGNQKYYNYAERYSFSFESSSKPIFILGHVNLNHLISYKNKRMLTKKNCMSFRYREKASTFIYYK